MLGVAENWNVVAGAAVWPDRDANGLSLLAENGSWGVLGCAVAPNWNLNGVVSLAVPPTDALELPMANGFVVSCCPVAEKLKIELGPEVALAVDEVAGALSDGGAPPCVLEEPKEKIGPVEGFEAEKENGLFVDVPGIAKGFAIWLEVGCTANGFWSVVGPFVELNVEKLVDEVEDELGNLLCPPDMPVGPLRPFGWAIL